MGWIKEQWKSMNERMDEWMIDQVLNQSVNLTISTTRITTKECHFCFVCFMFLFPKTKRPQILKK